jgi:hypothetical protein
MAEPLDRFIVLYPFPLAGLRGQAKSRVVLSLNVTALDAAIAPASKRGYGRWKTWLG